MIRAKTTITLSLDEIALLRLWLAEGRLQAVESDGFDEFGATHVDPETHPDVVELDRLDRKLERAVQRCYKPRPR